MIFEIFNNKKAMGLNTVVRAAIIFIIALLILGIIYALFTGRVPGILDFISNFFKGALLAS